MIISTDNGSIRDAYGDIEALRLIKKAGFDGVDYTFYDMKNDIFTMDDHSLYRLADEIRQEADQLGLSFPQAHAPFGYHYGEGSDSKNYLDIVRSFEFCARLGCHQMVIHTLKFPLAERRMDADVINLEYLRSFLPYAREFNVRIGVENLFIPDPKRHCYIGQHGTANEMNAFLDALDDPLFTVCCDLGHAAISGTEPEDFILGMNNKRLTMLHVQDTDYRHDLHTIPYLGRQDWDHITSALAGIGYQGAMNLEVLMFYSSFPKDMYLSALKLAADAARNLAEQVENKMT